MTFDRSGEGQHRRDYPKHIYLDIGDEFARNQRYKRLPPLHHQDIFIDMDDEPCDVHLERMADESQHAHAQRPEVLAAADLLGGFTIIDT